MNGSAPALPLAGSALRPRGDEPGADLTAELVRALLAARHAPPAGSGAAAVRAVLDHAVTLGAGVTLVDARGGRGATALLLGLLPAGPVPVLSSAPAGGVAHGRPILLVVLDAGAAVPTGAPGQPHPAPVAPASSGRQSGVASPKFGWDSLTRTEVKVSRLIAEGHTNRSAAAALYVSPNTISSHLRSVFTKLGVNSRVQLTRLVLQHPCHGAECG